MTNEKEKHVDTPAINIISVCSGIGGLDRGVARALRRMGFTARTVCYVEREAFACAILAERMESGDLDTAPVWTDIADFPAGNFAVYADMVIGGIPCQDFSVAGHHAGTDGKRWLWPDFWRVTRESNAKIIFVENVPGFISGKGLNAVLSDLAACGWDAQWDCFSAAEIGAPHKRERFFLLACRNRLAYSADIRSEMQRRIANGQTRTDSTYGAGDSMANADSERWNRRNQGSASGNPREIQAPRLCAAMGDAACEGLERDELRNACNQNGTAKSHGSVAQSGEISVWPPRPTDRNGWERIAIIRPDLVPAVRGKLNPRFVSWLMGFPPDWTEIPGAKGVDRLRALGNAVVSETAELALLTLWNRFINK